MSNAGNKLINLAKRHAELSAEIKDNKQEIGEEMSKCNGGEYVKPESESCTDFSFLFANESTSFESSGDVFFEWEKPTCLEMTYKTFAEFNRNHYDGYDYDELLFNYGCEHCQKARDLKSENGKLGKQRGAVRAAITRIGQGLLK